jgi:hypothetical protein
LFLAVRSAPCSISLRATSTCPQYDARCKGVHPSIRSAPRSTSMRATSTYPKYDAICNVVHPLLSEAVGSAPDNPSANVFATAQDVLLAVYSHRRTQSWVMSTRPCARLCRRLTSDHQMELGGSREASPSGHSYGKALSRGTYGPDPVLHGA